MHSHAVLTSGFTLIVTLFVTLIARA
jgi:hypothetical protein